MLKRSFYYRRKAKNSYPLRIGLFILIMLAPFCTLFAQNSSCKNLYIWPFKIKNQSQEKDTDLQSKLADEVEEIIISIDHCSVLQRRKYGQISNQFAMEEEIKSLEGVSQDLLQEFHLIGAKYVLFGEFSQDLNFNVDLRLTIESLATKKIEVAKSIFIPAEILIKRDQRYAFLESKIKACLLDDLLPLAPVVPEPAQVVPPSIKKPVANQRISKYGITINLNGCTIDSDTIACKLHVEGFRKERIIIPRKSNLINISGTNAHDQHSKRISAILYSGRSYSGATVSLPFSPEKSKEVTFLYALAGDEFKKPGVLSLNINGVGFTFSNYVILE